MAEQLAEVFQAREISDLFPNCISSGWINLSGSVEDLDDGGKLIFTRLMNEVRLCTLRAMRAFYDDLSVSAVHSSVLQALKLTFECRKKIHGRLVSTYCQTVEVATGAFFCQTLHYGLR